MLFASADNQFAIVLIMTLSVFWHGNDSRPHKTVQISVKLTSDGFQPWNVRRRCRRWVWTWSLLHYRHLVTKVCRQQQCHVLTLNNKYSHTHNLHHHQQTTPQGLHLTEKTLPPKNLPPKMAAAFHGLITNAGLMAAGMSYSYSLQKQTTSLYLYIWRHWNGGQNRLNSCVSQFKTCN